MRPTVKAQQGRFTTSKSSTRLPRSTICGFITWRLLRRAPAQQDSSVPFRSHTTPATALDLKLNMEWEKPTEQESASASLAAVLPRITPAQQQACTSLF